VPVSPIKTEQMAELRREVDALRADLAERADLGLAHIADVLAGMHEHLDTAAAGLAVPQPEAAGRERAASREQAAQRMPAPKPAAPVAALQPPARTTRAAVVDQGDGDVKLGRAETAVLTVLVQHGTLDLARISILSGYKIKSSSLANALGRLRSLGFAVGDRNATSATPEGAAALGPVPPMPTGRALIDDWMRRLGKAERAFLDALIDAYPRPLSNEQLSEATGYSTTSSSMANALGQLRTLRLISGDKHGNVAADELGSAR